MLGYFVIHHSLVLGYFVIHHSLVLGYFVIRHSFVLGYFVIHHSFVLGYFVIHHSFVLGYFVIRHSLRAWVFRHPSFPPASLPARIRSRGISMVTVAYGSTLLVTHTLDPITESWPITVEPPRIVALA